MCSCSPSFFFSLPLIFTLLAAGISPCHYLKTLMFSFQRNQSPLFFISRSSSFSLIHVSLDIKIQSKKRRFDSVVIFFSVSKLLGGYAISYRMNLLKTLKRDSIIQQVTFANKIFRLSGTFGNSVKRKVFLLNLARFSLISPF